VSRPDTRRLPLLHQAHCPASETDIGARTRVGLEVAGLPRASRARRRRPRPPRARRRRPPVRRLLALPSGVTGPRKERRDELRRVPLLDAARRVAAHLPPLHVRCRRTGPGSGRLDGALRSVHTFLPLLMRCDGVTPSVRTECPRANHGEVPRRPCPGRMHPTCSPWTWPHCCPRPVEGPRPAARSRIALRGPTNLWVKRDGPASRSPAVARQLRSASLPAFSHMCAEAARPPGRASW
jgi:hypothetical protein